MKDSYRDFGKYQRHLQNFLYQVKKFFKDFEVRIYTDDTGSEFSLKAAENYPCLKLLEDKLKDPGSFKTDFYVREKFKSSEL